MADGHTPKLSAQTPASVPVQIWRSQAGSPFEARDDVVAREEPLEIRVRGRSVAVTMRTPGHDQELAAGFLVTEGILLDRAAIVEMAPCLESESPENTLNVFLAPSVEIDFQKLTRHVFASSSCGLCGKASIEAVHQHFPPVASAVRVSAGVLTALPDQLYAQQKAFVATGGLHAAAAFTSEGRLMVLREDVGRHNAVDKVIGHIFLTGALPCAILLVSGRASFEIMQKALAARIPIVAAISAPSSLAVDFARESGQTLVGFLRGKGMNIYSSPERVSHSSR
jgi:FdhD protein